jgi:hypothetical protein
LTISAQERSARSYFTGFGAHVYSRERLFLAANIVSLRLYVTPTQLTLLTYAQSTVGCN